MAKIIYSPDGEAVIHKCWKEMPGTLVDGLLGNEKYFKGVKQGMVVLCSCGKVYIAKHTGYASLGYQYNRLGWWEARKYKRKAGNW